MRRRQAYLVREELRRTLNTEQAVLPPVSTPEANVVPSEAEKPKRGRPRKVKANDDISGHSG